MDREECGLKPFKVWDHSRRLRKSLVASSLKDLEIRGKEKMGIGPNESVKMVLECDGTQLEDGDYFRTLPYNTVIMILRKQQRWYPLNVDALRTALETIPRIVCETLHALDLHEECPSWKIMDNKGRITVVLHWDQRSDKVRGLLNSLPGTTTSALDGNVNGKTSTRKQPHSILKDRSTNNNGNNERLLRPPVGFFNETQIGIRTGRSGSFEGIHRHTVECGVGINTDAIENHVTSSSNGDSDHSPCDFHCCVLHEEGRKITVTRTVATSPIHQPKKVTKNVRFMDTEEISSVHSEDEVQSNSSETETDTSSTLTEDEGVSEKFLLLVDEQKRHLSIKDIGVILERLNSKIIDVERLDRENESNDTGCHNWTIKATIRGSGLEEIGLIYAGRYYEISEHPAYKQQMKTSDTSDDQTAIVQNIEALV